MNMEVEPPVEVPTDALLWRSPSRVIVPHLPAVLSDALDALVEEIADNRGAATVRSHLVAALIMKTPPRRPELRELIGAYRKALVEDAALRPADPDGTYRFMLHPQGPRTGRGATGTHAVAPRGRLRETKDHRAVALVVPVAISERLDELQRRAQGRPGQTRGGPFTRTSRQELIAAIVYRACRVSTASELALLLHGYHRVRVRRALLGPAASNAVLCKRYKPGPRPPQ